MIFLKNWQHFFKKNLDPALSSGMGHGANLQYIDTLDNLMEYSVSCVVDSLMTYFKVHDVCLYFAAPEYNQLNYKGEFFSKSNDPSLRNWCSLPYRSKSLAVYDDLKKAKDLPIELRTQEIRAYAGAPITYKGTKVVGALCVIDVKKRDDFNKEFLAILRNYANMLSFMTESLALHHDLSSFQARATMAVQGANLGLWDTNIRTGDTYFNDRWGTMLGYDPGELESKFSTWEQLIHPDDYARSMRALDEHLEGKTSFYEIEHRVRCKNGKWRWVLCRGRVFEWDESGVAVRALGIQSDIENIKAIEARLIHEQNKAEQANIAKTNFLENISHEIRTPLNGIIATAGLLANTDLDPKQRNYIGLITDSGDILLSLLNDVLDLSKIEAKKMEFLRNEFSLRVMIDRLVDLHSSQIINLPIDLKVEVAEDIPAMFIGDERRLKQVLSNFLTNAIRFTKEGFIEVSVERDPDHKDYICFHVKDSGVGIATNRLPFLFDKFVQGHSDKIAGGTGLGLAICKSLVEYMDGYIGVESILHEGSHFWFSVPLEVYEEKKSDSDSGKNRKIPQFNAHILLVEDVEMNRFIICDMLEETNITVDEASDGLEAVSKACENDYDMILMDLRLPIMDGFKATHSIIEGHNREKPLCPIVALTAHATEEHRDRCLQAGMSDFLTKPLVARRLYECLEKHLSDKIIHD